MLRITTIEKSQIATLRLEGRLAGDWVGELERCWISIKNANHRKKLKLDLSDVEFVDERGEELLERVFLEGAELNADNLFVSSIISDIEERSKVGHEKH
jgi:ABC-type transporter Mla MlaB component